MSNLNDIQFLLTPNGFQLLINTINNYKKGSADWLQQLKKENPTLCWIVDLAANKTIEEALDETVRVYGPLAMIFESQIRDAHKRLKFEIDKPRF